MSLLLEFKKMFGIQVNIIRTKKILTKMCFLVVGQRMSILVTFSTYITHNLLDAHTAMQYFMHTQCFGVFQHTGAFVARRRIRRMIADMLFQVVDGARLAAYVANAAWQVTSLVGSQFYHAGSLVIAQSAFSANPFVYHHGAFRLYGQWSTRRNFLSSSYNLFSAPQISSIIVLPFNSLCRDFNIVLSV